MKPEPKIPELRPGDFTYPLPPDRIAQHPLPDRDSSRLLCWKNGCLSEDVFRSLARHLPPDTLVVFNDSRVIQARLVFPRPTGSTVEIFCLEPEEFPGEPYIALHQTGASSWKCLIGNARRWKAGRIARDVPLNGKSYRLDALKGKSHGDGVYTIHFTWDPPECNFGGLIGAAGQVPLPPYICRSPVHDDLIRYQTIFASSEGSVAAPTAGLHFTGPVLDSLRTAGFRLEPVTLHVGLGTFRPITSPSLSGHMMHSEFFSVSRNTLRTILRHLGKPILAVGTTTVRTLESLYWLGLQVMQEPGRDSLTVDQWLPYQDVHAAGAQAEAALRALDSTMDRHRWERLNAETRLMILPGYSFRVIDGMLTNFHQPQSTLLLLVAAFLGSDWQNVYRYALREGFRFLSYGDACLFLNEPRNQK